MHSSRGKFKQKRKKAKNGTRGIPMLRRLAEEKGPAKETEKLPVRKGKDVPYKPEKKVLEKMCQVLVRSRISQGQKTNHSLDLGKWTILLTTILSISVL